MRKACHILFLFIGFIILNFYPLVLYSQVVDTLLSEEQQLENLSEFNESDQYLEDINEDNPNQKLTNIQINQISKAELQQLPFLTKQQIDAFIFYRASFGDIQSLNEFYAIPGFDSTTISRLVPYLKITPSRSQKLTFSDFFTKGRGYLTVRYQQVLEKQDGYLMRDSTLHSATANSYIGSAQRYLFRFTYAYKNQIQMGVVGEKDPGEQFLFGSNQYGMDFYNGYLALQNVGIIKALVVGSFKVDFGQGLTCSSGLSFGSLPSNGTLRRFASRVKSSLSSDEEGYLRGIACNLSKSHWNVAAFYSNHSRDGNLQQYDSLEGEPRAITSLQESGYHRTSSELEDKNVIREQIYGGNIEYRNNYICVGLTGSRSSFSLPIDLREEVFRQFSFQGNSTWVIGADYQWIFRSLYGFGEAARSQSGGWAWLSGLQLNLSGTIQISVVYRDYQRNYQNGMSNAIGHGGENTNERGLVMNVACKINSKNLVQGFFDLFQFPWFKYRTDFLSSGNECTLNYTSTPSPFLSVTFRFRQKEFKQNASGATMLHQPTSKISRGLKCQIDWRVNQEVLLRSRIEGTQFRADSQTAQYGIIVCQDLSYKPTKAPLTLTFRYGLVDCDGYDNRFYVYEPDMYGAISVPMLDGEMIRIVGMLCWEPFIWMRLSGRYGWSYYTDRSSVGNGLDRSSGNTRSEVKFQLEVKW